MHLLARTLVAIVCSTCLVAKAAEPDCVPQTQVDVSTIGAQIIVVGETHGTQEIPHFVEGLVCALVRAGKGVILGVEMNGDEQGPLNRYVGSVGSDQDRAELTRSRFWRSQCQYGQTSAAMLSLIDSVRRLSASGQRVGLLAIDAPNGADVPALGTDISPLSTADKLLYGRLRDRGMADRVLSTALLRRDYTLVVLTGSLHASTSKGNARDPEYLPLASVVEQQQSAFIIGFDAGAGSAWVATREGCKAQEYGPRSHYVDGTRLDSRLWLAGISASPPAVADLDR